MKEKEEKENFLIDEYLRINACHICHYNLIREESKILQKETKENTEKSNEQVIKAQGNYDELVENCNELVDQENENAEKLKEQVIKTKGSRNELVKKCNELVEEEKEANE